MDFSIPAASSDYRREVRSLLASTPIQEQLHLARREQGAGDSDTRALYRSLGEAGVLAPDWPQRYGGRDSDFSQTVVLLEELIGHGVPHSLYFITVQIVGSLILQAGSVKQKENILPRMASGELTACILFTEPDTGSDLAAVRTHGISSTEGWRINGHKRYNLKTSHADVALCAVRTDATSSRYEGITLFVVPLDIQGVAIRPLPSLSDEQFHDVRLVDVDVSHDAVLGSPSAGWSLITRLFSAERSGLDYYARGLRWLCIAAESLAAAPEETDDSCSIGLAQHWARLDASRLLTCRVLQSLQDEHSDITQASLSKWHCSETAQQISWWTLEALGLPATNPDAPFGNPDLEAGYREAAGLTISGGASEVLLEVVAESRLLDESVIGGAP